MSAGCGQLFIARRDAYEQCGGHAMLRDSLHDGIKLPRVFRQAGLATDLFDATDLATCRMYHTNADTWRGLGKNATEGLAAPGTILPMTALLLGGQVLPFVLLAFAPRLSSSGLALAAVAAALAYLPRLLAARLFRQPLGGALLHPTWRAGAARDSVACPRPPPRRQAVRVERPQLFGRRTRQSRMKQILSLLLVTLATGVSAAPNSEPSLTPTNAPSLIELRDQFDTPQTLSFPATNVTLLTIADKKGSEQIAGWITPLKQRFGKRIDIRGLADVSTVPRLLRGMIRMKFQKSQTYPVMMDWSGEAVKAFTYVPDKANVLVLDERGQILKRISGEANPKAVQDLCAAIDRALVNRAHTLATQ